MINKRSYRILHVIDGFSVGGAETWLLNCVRYLNLNPDFLMHFDFLITGGEKKAYDEEIISLGSKIHYVKFSVRRISQFRSQLKKILINEEYDCIYDHSDFISGWHFLALIGYLPPKRVSHLHNPYNFVNNYVKNFERQISFHFGRILNFLLTSKITGTSDSVMNEYGYNKWPYKTKRIDPIHCGFSVKRFGFQTKFYDKIRTELNLLANMKICLFLGRIGLQSYDKAPNQKNPEFAFEIAKVLCDIDPEWVVLFVGSKGMFGETLEQEVLISRLGGNIRFLGVRNDVEALLSASDVLLFPSKWEGLGMVVVEAQASNLPVIMSTGLPSESVVIPKLVKQLELKQSPAFWAQQILTFNRRTVNCDLEESKIKIQQSPFSIENSIQRIFMVAQS